jgi:hypothetical protein
MLPASHRVRAYFAPVTRSTATPTLFDPAAAPTLSLDAPPSPWIDLGWIENLKRTSKTEFVPVAGGAKSAATALARKSVSAQVEFDFCEWGKLQMALAGGSQHMNVLATSSGATPTGSGGFEPIASVRILSGSSAGQLILAPISVLSFSIGDLVVVDIDYTGQTGYVGAGISGAYVKSADDVRSDVNYIRRVTFNVARVAGTTTDSLLLAQPLPAGAPPANAGVQKVVGFVDREGGSFFQEWSALFVVPEENGARVCIHYPRLQPIAPAGEASIPISKSISAFSLRAAFTALPVTDANDNEQVLCYRSFFPAPNSALY